MAASETKLILVVEDEPKIARLILDYLDHAGYRSHWIERGDEAVAWIRAQSPSLVLLDVMLPGLDGMEVCRAIRAFSNLPVIMLTARVEEIDRLLGLELGADDYICKPFSPREVMARIKAVLRRIGEGGMASPSERLVVDAERHSATLDGRLLDLTPVEFRLLSILGAQPGRVFSRDQLLDRLYDDHRIVTDRTVDSHVKNLRKKMQAVTPAEDIIRSIYGVGYKLEI
jgi:two-component system response regulator BaeR